MSNEIKKTFMYGLLLHSLASPSNTTMADRRVENGRDSKVESNLNLHEVKITTAHGLSLTFTIQQHLIGPPSITEGSP